MLALFLLQTSLNRDSIDQTSDILANALKKAVIQEAVPCFLSAEETTCKCLEGELVFQLAENRRK